ncbi:testis development-related protein isoform X2 [Rousettus aegyptiacus]|uniref:testis development-related protein isoform X2 n=1 Tax=Rousettus aegyptiacus TaxID=9407 RepID=UPI00168CF768|nr:testis development-related protein isoform X2 [Rousettus aegyptiacus]
MGTGGPEPRCPVLAARPGVQGASFRGWKEVASLFNSEDEQHLLGAPESPRSRGTHLRPREEPKAEKKSGFWEHLALKHNAPPKKPDEIEGWEPPKFALGDEAAEAGDAVSACATRPGWEPGAKGSGGYSSLAGSAHASRWSLRSAGRAVSIRRQGRGQLMGDWEELE